jgi:hypothetical protein
MNAETESPVQIPIPKRIAKLPVDKRGYPIPFFVGYDDRDEPDFRMMDGRKLIRAVKDRLCWICGDPLGRHLAFCIGPMCMVNRNNAEPPMHLECAQFSVKACPFLLNPEQKRNPRKVHGKWQEAAGEPIKRNPGVSVIWVCESYDVYHDYAGGVLFRIGAPPSQVTFWREGRPALRPEIVESIETGIPLLYAMAKEEGEAAVKALMAYREKAYSYLPSDGDSLKSEVDVPA